MGFAITTIAYGWAGASPGSAGPALSIAISGNHFVNGAGETIRLLGVNAPSTEYACDEGWGYSSQPLTEATALGIASWDADAVRVPLNEDCWLGLNGQPSYGTQAGYQGAIESWVADLNAAGLYVILDLHWSAPGSLNADGQRPMPDDHSVAFWTSVATVFEDNPAVVFDAFNEPYSPAGNGDSALAVSWSCWRNGGCAVPVASDGSTVNDSDTYVAAGMQALVTAIRATGANQPILLGGLSYANDLSGWIANEPSDPDNQLAASFHNYYGESCDSSVCWNNTIATVAAHVPVVTGEFDQGYDCGDPPTSPSGLTTFDQTFMNWADENGVSYLAWGWWVLGNTTTSCAALGGGGDNYALISDYSGTAVSPDGLNLFLHLKALSSAPSLQITTASVPVGGVKAKYSTTLAASNGNSPYVWSLVAGTLPRGVVLTSAGVITGKPKVGGTFPFTVEVEDTSSSTHTQEAVTRTYTLTISQPTPTITAVRPDSGPEAGGTKVTIIGSSLEGTKSVTLGGTPATRVTVNAAGTRVHARVPAADASGTVGITVTTPGGINVATPASSFTYVSETLRGRRSALARGTK